MEIISNFSIIEKNCFRTRFSLDVELFYEFLVQRSNRRYHLLIIVGQFEIRAVFLDAVVDLELSVDRKSVEGLRC